MFPYPSDEKPRPDFLYRFEFESYSDINAIVLCAKSYDDALGLFVAILGETRLDYITSIHRIV